jgi:hypothetical protein
MEWLAKLAGQVVAKLSAIETLILDDLISA